MKSKRILYILLTVFLCLTFAGASSVMFIFGDSLIASETDWMLSLYAVSAIFFVIGLFMVLFPKVVFRMMYNKYTVKSMEESYHGYVAPEYSASKFFKKFRWGLMCASTILVLILALLSVYL